MKCISISYLSALYSSGTDNPVSKLCKYQLDRVTIDLIKANLVFLMLVKNALTTHSNITPYGGQTDTVSCYTSCTRLFIRPNILSVSLCICYNPKCRNIMMHGTAADLHHRQGRKNLNSVTIRNIVSKQIRTKKDPTHECLCWLLQATVLTSILIHAVNVVCIFYISLRIAQTKHAMDSHASISPVSTIQAWLSGTKQEGQALRLTQCSVNPMTMSTLTRQQNVSLHPQVTIPIKSGRSQLSV